MNLSEVGATKLEVLCEGELIEVREISPSVSATEVPITIDEPGEYSIEMAAEIDLLEELRELQQQDALEISSPKAKAMWDVTVEPAKDRLEIDRIWTAVTNLLVLRELISIVRNRKWQWVLDRIRRFSSDTDSAGENMTLDEFRKE